MGGQDAVAAEDHAALAPIAGRTWMRRLQLDAAGVHNTFIVRGRNTAMACRRSACGGPRPRPSRWAQSRATTISPPTSCNAISTAGRANKPAYHRSRAARWTYGQLADRVARFGAALRALGIRREERVLLALLDTIDWPTAFLGCLKAGVVAVPVNTLMTEDDYRFMLADSRAQMPGGVGGAVSEIREADRAKPRPRARHRLRRQSARLPAVRGSHRRRRAGGLHRADHARRHGVLALHLGLDRQAEGRGACACQPEAHRRSLRHAGRSASRRATSAIRWPSCSSPMASATP